jgi:dTDP-4-dehydrorhamnose reductase
MRRVVVFGGSGQLGTEIRRLWDDVEIVAPSSREVDLEDTAAVEGIIERSAPDTVVNCAAYHHVDRCEALPERPFAVNAGAVERLAQACAKRDATFVTYSTDYVFDGTLGRPYIEADAPNPQSVYGVSKLAGEQLVLRLRSRAFVIRTCGVYGTRTSSSKGYTFVDRILTQAQARERPRVVDDMFVSPSYAAHLASATRELVRTQRYGLYHMVNEGPVSWYDFAHEALRQAGLDATIEPISYAAWPSPVRRPAYSALENAKLHALGIRLPSWQAGIRDYLEARALRPRYAVKA